MEVGLVLMAAVGQGEGKMEGRYGWWGQGVGEREGAVEDRRQRKGGEVGGGERRWEG
jgi:hypothetical protein